MAKQLDLGNATVPTAYQPLTRNISPAELPPEIAAMRARNAEYSRFFIGKKDARAKFFREHDFQLVVNDCIDERRARTAQSLCEGDLATDGPVPPGSIEIVRGAGSQISFRSQAAASLENNFLKQPIEIEHDRLFGQDGLSCHAPVHGARRSG